LGEQGVEVTTYLKAKIGAILVHFLIFVLLIFSFFWIRNTIKEHAENEPALQDAAHVFDVPFSNALLIGLLAAVWLYPGQPRLLWAAVGATALIPTVIVTRRLIDPASFPILYATVVAFFVDQLRYVVSPAGILSRFLFIFELLAASIFLLIALRFKHLSATAPDQTRLKRLTRLYLHIAFVVLVFAGFVNILGYIKLSILIGNGMLESSYLAVILYAAVRIVDALAISALNIRPLSSLGMVRRHHGLLYANITVAIRWLFFAAWFVAALQFFSQLDLAWQEVNTLLWNDKYKWFNIKFTLGAVLAFPVTIWATFLLSRFIRFCLEEEVYPHMHLGRGIPYAASTMVHYTILLVGFFAAVAATGTELSQFAFLAGAFGVGLGFGLQNIMNNFVSGVILLFERPIKVGDVIQIDPATMGTVERIGIRASVILLANGAEVIVPNGNLISNPVTNWTLSNCERQIEIPITVASKVDPQHVISLLTNIASKHPDVLKNPAPRAYLVTLASASLTFRLSAWIDSAEEWMKITSDLSLAINATLARENIALG
jgi:small-conductance mechanosensitive channel